MQKVLLCRCLTSYGNGVLFTPSKLFRNIVNKSLKFFFRHVTFKAISLAWAKFCCGKFYLFTAKDSLELIFMIT
jgi:hypothetical protein